MAKLKLEQSQGQDQRLRMELHPYTERHFFMVAEGEAVGGFMSEICSCGSGKLTKQKIYCKHLMRHGDAGSKCRMHFCTKHCLTQHEICSH